MSITLNSVPFYPSDAPIERSKIGVTLVSANGTRRFIQRMSGATPIVKSQWPLKWNSVPNSVRTAVLAIYALNTTFPYVDETGASFTVQCEADGFSAGVAFIAGNGDVYYDLELTIYQV